MRWAELPAGKRWAVKLHKRVGLRWNVPRVNRPVGVHANSLTNLRKAVVERVFMVKGADGALIDVPRPQPGVFERQMRWIREQLVSKVRRVRPLSKEQFLKTYSGRRLALYKRAAARYEQRGVKPKDARIRSFLKIEGFTKRGAVPRIIQPRNPRLPVYGYALGRYIKIYEKVFMSMIKRVTGYRVIVKGLDPRKRAELLRRHWDVFGDPVVLAMDASRFDQHVSRAALRWEHAMWLQLCPSKYREELKMLLDMQLRNVCTASCPQGTVSYVTDGCRMSGDMNTSGGNCMLMASMLLQYAHDREVVVRVANDGDDSLVIMDRRDLVRFREGLEEWFDNLGFAMEVEDVQDRFERIDFCQCSPVLTSGGWIMCRKPTNSMGKDLTTFRSFPNEQAITVWLQAVHECGKSLTDGVPVMGRFYDMFRTGRVVKAMPEALQDRGLFRMAQGLKYRGLDITSQARASFWNAFGILPDDQLALEEWFSGFSLVDFPDCGNVDPWKMPRMVSTITPRI